MKKNDAYFWLPHAIITLLVILVYVNSFTNDFVSDDILAILENPLIGRWDNVMQGKTMFVGPLLHNVVFSLFGPNPVWFRLINILAHLASSNLIFVILLTIASPLVAFIAAALFAVHPLQVESVSWISGAPYSLYTAFFLASFYLYIKAKQSSILYIPSAIAYILSLSSGFPAVILSAILVLYEYCFGNIRKKWQYLMMYIGLSVVYGLIALTGVDERMSAFSAEVVAGQEYFNPLLQIPVAITSYITLFLWPQHLTLYHSEFRFGNGQYIFSVVVFIAVLTALIWSYRKNIFIFFSLSVFIVSLLPMLTPFGFQWVYAERYAYFATIGLVSLSAYLLSNLQKFYPTLPYIAVAVIIMGLSARTVIRNTDWKNEDTLWSATAKTSPSYYGTHNNMGGVYVRQGNYQKAIEEFQKSIELNPGHADAYYNIAIVYAQHGYKKESIPFYLKSIELNSAFWKAQQNVAIVFAELGQLENAEKYMLLARENNPYSSVIQASIGIIHAEQGNIEEAREDFKKALEMNPNEQLALNGLLRWK